MDVNRKREADWPHWPGRGSRPARRDRLERRLFFDSEREAELEEAVAAIRRLEEAAAAKATQIERLERAVGETGAEPEPAVLEPVPDPEPDREPVPEPQPEPDSEPEPEPEPELEPAAAGDPYLLFAWTPQGYLLHEGRGDVPDVGAFMTLEGVEHTVAKLARSPLPGDARPCAYLEPV